MGSHIKSDNTHTIIKHTPLSAFTRADRKNTGPSKNGGVKLIQLHMYQGSPLFSIFHALSRASTVIPLLPMANFTPSIKPNLGLPSTCLPLTSAINTFLVIRYSSILSTCPNHLNSLCSALLANSLSIPALLRTSSFLTLSIRDTPTKLLKHFI